MCYCPQYSICNQYFLYPARHFWKYSPDWQVLPTHARQYADSKELKYICRGFPFTIQFTLLSEIHQEISFAVIVSSRSLFFCSHRSCTVIICSRSSFIGGHCLFQVIIPWGSSFVRGHHLCAFIVRSRSTFFHIL